MFFNSWEFAIFAVLVFSCYYLLRHREQNIMLLAASYVFYGAWDYRFLSLILLSTIVDYSVGLALQKAEEQKYRKLLLFTSCAINLGMLGFFKYFNFFVDSAEALMAGFGLGNFDLRLNIVLPVGISFYTFQTMSYTVDIYRGKLAPCRNFIDFALFVSYFPQLVAGPIERATNLLPQISKKRSVQPEQWIEGGWLIFLGLFKKVAIADNLAIVVDSAFNSTIAPSGQSCLLAIYAFAFQIYCDFSGYSDIARGLAKLMGIEIMQNFRLPYLAQNPREFWQRWHISLSTWLRDYLYIPLGGNRHGALKTYRNLMITMLLGGLWHGASWTFILWGAFHGILLAAHRYLFQARQKIAQTSIAVKWFKRVSMFHLVCAGWLLFRATSLHQIGSFLKNIFFYFSPDIQTAALAFYTIFFVGILSAVEICTRDFDDPRKSPICRGLMGSAMFTAMFYAMLVFASPEGSAFIYFQF